MHAGNRCREPLTSKPRKAVLQHTQKTRCTQRIQRKAFQIGYSPSQQIWRTWRSVCPRIPLKERSQSRKVMLQKWRQKRRHIVHAYFPQKPKEIFSTSSGDLIAADHKVLNEESESRNNHRYAVVVQDLVTQWIQCYPCRTGDGEESTKVSGAVTEAKRSFSRIIH